MPQGGPQAREGVRILFAHRASSRCWCARYAASKYMTAPGGDRDGMEPLEAAAVRIARRLIGFGVKMDMDEVARKIASGQCRCASPRSDPPTCTVSFADFKVNWTEGFFLQQQEMESVGDIGDSHLESQEAL